MYTDSVVTITPSLVFDLALFVDTECSELLVLFLLKTFLQMLQQNYEFFLVILEEIQTVPVILDYV